MHSHIQRAPGFYVAGSPHRWVWECLSVTSLIKHYSILVKNFFTHCLRFLIMFWKLLPPLLMLNVMACLFSHLAPIHDNCLLLPRSLRKICILKFSIFTSFPWEPLWDFLEHSVSFQSTDSGFLLFACFSNFCSSLLFIYRPFSGLLECHLRDTCFRSSLSSAFLLIVLLFPLYL